MRRAYVLVAAALAAACSRGPGATPAEDCAAIQIGMPEAVLLERLGTPSSKIGGEVVRYLYRDKGADIGVEERTNKVAEVVCSKKKIVEYFTEKDEQEAKDAAAADSPEGRERASRNWKSLAALRLALQKWQSKNGGWDKRPVSLDALEQFLPDRLPPDLDLPAHGKSRWGKTYGSEVCERRGDINVILADKIEDTGQWGYIGDGPCVGHIFIDCSHMSGSRRRWSDQ